MNGPYPNPPDRHKNPLNMLPRGLITLTNFDNIRQHLPAMIVWKMVGWHLMLNTIPNNFTGGSGRKFWFDRGIKVCANQAIVMGQVHEHLGAPSTSPTSGGKVEYTLNNASTNSNPSEESKHVPQLHQVGRKPHLLPSLFSKFLLPPQERICNR